MFLVDLTGFLIGLILLLMLVVSVTIFVVAMWKEYHNEFFSVKDLIDDTATVLKAFCSTVGRFLRGKGKTITKKNQKANRRISRQEPEAAGQKAIQESGRDYSNIYQDKPFMAREEIAHFRKLQRWAGRKDYLVFAKVRLADLVSSKVDPQISRKPYAIIQSRIADFIVCDHTMAVRCVVLINDSKRTSKQRTEMVRFMRDVLTSCGYRVLITEAIVEKDLDKASCG